MEFVEEFKEIEWTKGIFQVSNYGRVYNTITKRILKGFKDKKKGYWTVSLRCKKFGIKETWSLHKLVATVWQRPVLSTENCHHKNKFLWCNCCYNIQIIDEKTHKDKHSE